MSLSSSDTLVDPEDVDINKTLTSPVLEDR